MRHVALALVALSLVAAPNASATSSAFDGAHDIAVYKGQVLVPVDSIDLVHAELVGTSASWTGGVMRVVDLSRSGLETTVFAHREHTVRVWFMVSFVGDGPSDPNGSRVVVLALDDARHGGDTLRGAVGLQVFNDRRVVDLNASVVFDEAADAVRFSLGTPAVGEPTVFVGSSLLIGCGDDGACGYVPLAGEDERLNKVVAADVAPDRADLGWLASVMLSLGWNDLPEDEAGLAPRIHDAFVVLDAVA